MASSKRLERKEKPTVKRRPKRENESMAPAKTRSRGIRGSLALLGEGSMLSALRTQ
jgi:hypothetical protein